MRGFIMLAALLATAFAFEQCGQKGPGVLSRIINGENAGHGEFPWQISMRRIKNHRSKHWCGGTLIASNYVLSAAHCVVSGSGKIAHPSSRRIRVGEWRQNDWDGSQRDYEVEKIVVHEGWGRKTNCSMPNDIALLKTKKAIVSSKFVGPACMPNVGEDYRGTKHCLLSGWGKVKSPSLLNQTNRYPNILQKLDGSIWLDADLKRKWESLPVEPDEPKIKICPGQIGFGGGRESACEGDSGGPLVCPSKSRPGSYDVVGVVSWGHRTCQNMPGAFTEVVYFLDWIKAHMI